MGHPNSLTPEENVHVRAVIAEILRKHESQASFANSLIMPDGHPPSQQVVSEVLRGKPIGVSLARAIARAQGITFDELVSGRCEPAGAAGGRATLYESVPGWPDAAHEVLEKKFVPGYAVSAVGKMPVTIAVKRVTPELVYDLAVVWMRHAPLEVRIEAEKADLDDELAQHQADEGARRRRVATSGEVARQAPVPVGRRAHR